MLTPIDRHLVLFERRLRPWPGSIDNAGHRHLLERFASWHVLRRLRTSADAKPLQLVWR